MSAEQLAFVRLTMRRMGETVVAGSMPAGTGLLKVSSGTLSIAVPGTDYVASTGVAGGQTVTGGTGSGQSLTLTSTAHATKGFVYVGSATGLVYDQANSRAAVGGAPLATGPQFQVINAGSAVAVANSQVGMVVYGSSSVYSEVRTAGVGVTTGISSATGVAGTVTNHAFALITNNGSKVTITAGGNVLAGSTTDASGKLQVTASGTPSAVASGSPVIVAYAAGNSQIVVRDQANVVEGWIGTSTGGAVQVGAATSHVLDLMVNGTTRARVTTNGNVLVGTTTDVASSRLRVSADKTVASAAGAVWNAVDVMASTLTLTGTTTTNLIWFTSIAAPTITSASVVNVGRAATLYIGGQPTVSGTATITADRSYAIYVDSTSQCHFPVLRSEAGISYIVESGSHVFYNNAAAQLTVSGGNGSDGSVQAGQRMFFRPYRDTQASASTLTLQGNWSEISGTTTINYITTTGHSIGTAIMLRFAAALTVTHNAAAPPANTAAIRTTTGANITTANRYVLVLVYDGTNWCEVSRAAVA